MLLGKSVSKHCISERWLPLIGCFRLFSSAAKVVMKIKFMLNALLMFCFCGRTKEAIQMLECKPITQGEPGKLSRSGLTVAVPSICKI